ncbi:mitochondrial ribosomal protein subunit L20-domain-containing protein [Exophiala viscosa]|uniref:Mitochondrial ribosomal protein subunit L20-domain-containing protein n=1 Tax=Exophiala viscosa TaxID=2486360 RepID=A0AAN6DPF9_9EURO|nr:mitochondrial ribosomal protein subunit L20-domain-containing protein [Exophiala viscosa]KAI1620700.1 mitochondrial ribosomal protein subunit L20-domain-containing protein [Exophiala viscosa]
MKSATIFSQPLTASSRFYKLCAQILQPSFRRHESTYRRARSKLNIKPDASFLPSKTEQHDHIIYNPPPSMPNIYHTPNIFLPKNDRRKIMSDPETRTKQMLLSQQVSPMKGHREKRYHLTEKEVEEMKQLRKDDPMQWSVNHLAKKFDCSPIFAMYATEGLAPEKQEQQKLVTEVVKSRWGKKRREAREDRALRKERWYRDE